LDSWALEQSWLSCLLKIRQRPYYSHWLNAYHNHLGTLSPTNLLTTCLRFL
jgi:hypothetical protein